MVFRLRRRRERVPPRIRLLELAVATRHAASRLGLLANRVRRTYMRTGDEALLSTLESILRLQAVLDVLSVRLETLAEVGAVNAESLAAVRYALRAARESYAAVAPSAATMMAELENMVAALASETGVELPQPSEAPATVDQDAERILEEAAAIAEKRIREMMT